MYGIVHAHLSLCQEEEKKDMGKGREQELVQEQCLITNGLYSSCKPLLFQTSGREHCNWAVAAKACASTVGTCKPFEWVTSWFMGHHTFGHPHFAHGAKGQHNHPANPRNVKIASLR